MSAKRRFKNALVHGGRLMAHASTSQRVVVLCYHSVHSNLPFASVSPTAFERHLRWLRETCHVVPFSSIPLDPSEAATDRPTVAITFDDGYLDNYTEAFPLLMEHSLPATFFVTAGFINREPTVLDRFSRDRKMPGADIHSATWPQLREMYAAGMEIEDHTFRHPNLSRLTLAEAVDEFARSRHIIEDRLGAPVRSTAYPYGKIRRHFTKDTIAAAQAVGFDRAAAVAFRGMRRGDSPWAVPRFFVARDDENTLRDKIFGAWDVIGVLQETVPPALARVVSPIDFAY